MAIYYIYSGAAGSNNGTNWANAYTTLTAAISGKPAGTVLYVAHDHVETTAAPLTLSLAGTADNLSKVVCVNRAGTVPPISADRRATAQVLTTGADNGIAISGSCVHYDGIIFRSGSGSTSTAHLNVATVSGAILRFDNCSLRLGIASTGSRIEIGNSSAGGIYVEFNTTTFSFAHIGHTVTTFANVRWLNTPSALIGAAVPTILFTSALNRGGSAECIGVDFSAAAAGKTLVDTGGSQASTFKFIDCKLHSSVTKSTPPSAPGAADVDFVRCGASGVNYAIHRHRQSGLLIDETVIVRSGGSSDGTTPISWKVVTTVNCTYSNPFVCPPIAIWNDITGSAVTATVEGIWGGGAVPNDDDIWLDVEYLGDATSPQGSFINDGKADLVATAAGQTSSSETWGGSTTKFKLGVTFTPQQKGWIYARVRCAKASSTFYVDALVTLT